MGRATSNILPRPLGRGQKVKYHLIQLQSQFQRFVYQTLCVFSQMKDKKHIRMDFHSVAWVMPQLWDFGAPGRPGGQKIFHFKHGQVTYLIDGDDEQNRMQVKFSPYGQTGDLGVRSKGQLD